VVKREPSLVALIVTPVRAAASLIFAPKPIVKTPALSLI